MEFQKTLNLLDTTSDEKDLLRFVTIKRIEVYDQSKGCPQKNWNWIETPLLKSDLCDFGDAYIVVKRNIFVAEPDEAIRNKSLAFRNNAPFINCISKIIGIQLGNAEDLDHVMAMYNLLEYSKNYKRTTGSLWNHYRDETSDPLSSNSESFK